MQTTPGERGNKVPRRETLLLDLFLRADVPVFFKHMQDKQCIYANIHNEWPWQQFQV